MPTLTCFTKRSRAAGSVIYTTSSFSLLTRKHWSVGESPEGKETEELRETMAQSVERQLRQICRGNEIMSMY